MRSPDLLQPSALDGDVPVALDQYSWRFLAEGDSWFSLGSLNPFKNANLTNNLEFLRKTCVLTCAQPGDTLRHMSEMGSDPWFQHLLFGNRAQPWSAILLSAGGNDLIDAARVLPSGAAASDASLRLLLKPEEWGPASLGVSRFISAAGWQRFEAYLNSNYEHLISMRDDSNSQSQGVPIFTHTYAFPTPRNAPSGPMGPWLYPAMRQYQLPVTEWIAIAHELLTRLGCALKTIAADAQRFPNIQVFDSAQVVDIEPAHLGDTEVSGDWVDEIHLTRKGCVKLARAWSKEIDQVLKRA